MVYFVVGLLVLTNIGTILWGLKRKPKVSKQVLALQKAIAAFEVEGQSILSIQRIPPDSVFLRSVGRH